MPKPSAPDRQRSQLLKLAAAVADGDHTLPRLGSNPRALNGLRVIAALSQQLNSLQPDALPIRPARTAQFQWGHLDVIEPLGSGTSADVFRAYDPLLDIEVALKLSRPNLGRRATAEWISEARRLARLRHPNVVAVHGVDVHDGRAGLWLDLVDGETLADYGERCAPLPARELSLIGIELCRGLAAIHAAGMLHRDIKPANLLRDRAGRILITDFGAAGSAALSGNLPNLRGTPLTMAPELIAGGISTVASDLYSLGVVLFWLATGRLPLIADDLEGLHRLHRQRAMAGLPLEIEDQPPSLVQLIEHLLAPAPEARPADAYEIERQLAQTLESIADTHTQAVRDETFTRTVGIDFDRIAGRDAELAWLQQAQRRAMLGHAHPILLCGDSGTGKSTLIRSFGEALRARGGRMLHIGLSGYPPGRRRLGALLARSVDPSLTDSGAGAHRAPAEILRRLAVETPVVVVCLDDLEHADAGEQEQIRNLVADLRGSSVLPVCVLRTDERPDETASTALFGNEPFDLLMLEPFSPGQTEHAIGVLLGAPDYENNLSVDAIATLHGLSGGNPFFLTELLRHLIASGELTVDHAQRHCHLRSLPASLPTNLELAALERCRSLPAQTRVLLDAAAVIGERFRLSTLTDLLPETAGHTDESLMPALRAGLLEPLSPGLFRFRHGLIQRALYDAIPTDTRRNLHRACVALLEREMRPEAQGWLSLHAERAGDLATAFAAGYRAMTRTRLPEMSSLAHCERLLKLADAGVRISRNQRLELELRHIHALCTAGQLREADNLASRLDEDHRRRPGSSADLRIRLSCAFVSFSLGHHGDAVARLESLFGSDAPTSPTQRALMDEIRLLSVRARAALGDYRAAELLMSVALLDPPSDPKLRLESQALLGWCVALQGRLREADEILDRALRVTREAEPALRADILRRIHWVKLCRGRYQQAYALAFAAHADYRSVGNAMGQGKMSMALGQVRLMQGLPEEALGYLNRTALRLEDIGDQHCEAETVWLLGRAYTELGRLDDAETHIERALDLIARIGDRDDEFRFLIERARLRLQQKRPLPALDDATKARDIARELDSLDGVAFAETEMAAAHFNMGDAQIALALCEPAAQNLRKLGFGEHWRADWLLGRCRQALDQPEEAIAAACASARDAIERTIAELDPSDQPRRERIRQSREAIFQPLLRN
jgi:tetratricopeptide (TPR) repeat protein